MTRRTQRGSALVLVLIMMLSLAALAASAIYMTASSGMLSRFHDRERDLQYAVETALELGKSRLQRDTTLALYDTGYTQLLTNQAVYTSSGGTITGLTVNLYAAYTGDTSGTYVPYISLLATVSDPSGIRLARRMDLYAQSFSRYTLFANSLGSGTIGAGENFPGRVHVNSNFYGASSGSPNPVFSDTVSAGGTISGNGQWADTVSSARGATVIPYPSMTSPLAPSTTALATRLSALASAGNVSFTPATGSYTNATSGPDDMSGKECNTKTGCSTAAGSRLEFVAFDVNNSGAIDSTEGFFRVFDITNGGDTVRLAMNYAVLGGQVMGVTQQVDEVYSVQWQNQCGAFYTIGGRREFFPVGMHVVSWVKQRIITSTYPTVSAADTTAMGTGNRSAFIIIMRLPTSRCFPYGSPYLVNVERFTNNVTCVPVYSGTASSTFTWGSAPVCASSRYGGQDTTFTARIISCFVNLTVTTGPCWDPPVELGAWRAYGGTSNLPANLGPVRQTAERAYLWPISTTYNPNYRGVIYADGNLFVSGTVRGRATLFVNGPVSLIDDVMYDRPPADTGNLCRNSLGLIAKDSIMVADNAINRSRWYKDSPGDSIMGGGNRDFVFHGTLMALGGSVSAFNPSGTIKTNPVATCPTGSAFTTSGGCMQVVGGTIMNTYAPPYNSAVANSGLRPLRELDPCQLQNRRPPYFPLAATRVRALKSFDVDVRQIKTAALLTAYYNRLRGARAAP